LAIVVARALPLIAIMRLSPDPAIYNENVTRVKQIGHKNIPLSLGQ
jgi:hypothetical protein